MKVIKRILIVLFLILSVTCIDPYSPNIKNYNLLLNVEGLVTNENSSYVIKLQRTTKDAGAIPEAITDANVYITDNDGNTIRFKTSNDGYYKSDSTSFTGIVGKKYTLHILTGDGKEYKSDECTMLPVGGIDTLYYEKSTGMTGVNSEISTGLNIYLNSSSVSDRSSFYRWTFEEDWKFMIPCPKRFDCIVVVNEETFLFNPVKVVKDVCWRKNLSDEIIINSVTSSAVNYINRQLIKFIDPVKSDRLTKQYRIIVKQYSLSETEYQFWKNLKSTDNAGGDIFSSQPYTVQSNIHNVNDPGEMVLGYFEVSAVSKKQIYIVANKIQDMDLPQYKYDCEEQPRDPAWWAGTVTSFYDIYYKIMKDYTFLYPVINSDGTLKSLVFATKACSLCEFAGKTERPDFWIDM